MKVAVAGAGAVGRSVTRELVENGHDITLIERNPDHLDAAAIPEAHWRLGDACELSLLESIHLEEFDVVVAATGDDKVNVVLSLLAKTEFAVPRVVARVNDPRNEWLFNDAWGVDVAVSTPRMLASLIEEAVTIGDLVRLMEFRTGQANLVEITLPDNTPWGGKPVRKLQLPRDAALVTILRGPRVIVPEADEPLEGGDELLFVAVTEAEEELSGCCCRPCNRRALLAAGVGVEFSCTSDGRGVVRGQDGALGCLDCRVGGQRGEGGQRPTHPDPGHSQPTRLIGVVEVPLDDEPGSKNQRPTQGGDVKRKDSAGHVAPGAIAPAEPAPQVADYRPPDQDRQCEDHRPQQRHPDAQQEVPLGLSHQVRDQRAHGYPAESGNHRPRRFPAQKPPQQDQPRHAQGEPNRGQQAGGAGSNHKSHHR